MSAEEREDQLEALAKAATPGPWRRIGQWYVAPDDGPLPHTLTGCTGTNADNNAAYIAAADPPTVLALIEDARKWRRMIDWRALMTEPVVEADDEPEWQPHRTYSDPLP